MTRRRWLLAAALAIGVVGAGVAWLAVRPPVRPPVGKLPVAGRGSVPVDRQSTAQRLKAAETAAYPHGLALETAEGVHVVLDHGTLVDAPFGPVLVNQGSAPDGAHAESGYVAVNYLRAQGAGFALVHAYPEAVRSGSFGQLGDMAVSRQFSTLPVIYTQGGGAWQGYTCQWTSLTELQPGGPVELVSFMDSYDDAGGVSDGDDAISIEGKIADIVPGKSFRVHFSGTRTFDALYVRHGDKYDLQGGDANALSGC
ncbi:MAG: hypothetical protein WC816_06610 [Sphingomonas sp.]|jgi:hypothetical protein